MRNFFVAALLAFPPLPAFAVPSPLTLDLEIVRNDSVICRDTKLVHDGETSVFCDDPRVAVKITPEILPANAEAERVGARRQVKISASVEATGPEAWDAHPMIVALDGERAEISGAEVTKEGVPIDSFSMTVTPRIP